MQVAHLPVWQPLFSDELAVAQSTRHGGVSLPPYASLNLGLYTPDHPYHVAENRRRFCVALGVEPERLAGARQVHGAEVLEVTEDGQWDGYDALVCRQPGIYLTVTVADCVPVLFYDPEAKVVGAAHAGWRGTVAGIARKTLLAMQDLGAKPQRCWAYIGTCIDECDFAVGPEVAQQFDAPYQRWDETRARHFVDLKAANRDQLLALGVPATQVDVSPFSTVTNVADYFSHRAEAGQTGRGLGLIGMRG